MRRLLTDNHSPASARRGLVREAIRAYRSLLAAGVIERLPEPDAQGRTVGSPPTCRPTSLSTSRCPPSPSPLSTCSTPEAETYALDVVSVLEATLEDPRQVLSAQQHKARGEAVAAMKAEGIEYEERMELLTEVTCTRNRSTNCSAAPTRSTGRATRG